MFLSFCKVTEPYKVSDCVKCYEYQKQVLQIWKFHAFLDRGPDLVLHNGTTIELVQFCDPRGYDCPCGPPTEAVLGTPYTTWYTIHWFLRFFAMNLGLGGRLLKSSSMLEHWTCLGPFFGNENNWHGMASSSQMNRQSSFSTCVQMQKRPLEFNLLGFWDQGRLTIKYSVKDSVALI